MKNSISLSAGVNRRGFLKCLAWAGTGIVWTVSGGVPRGPARSARRRAAAGGRFTFVQISDSHIGFTRRGQPRPGRHAAGSASTRIAQLAEAAGLPVHTGDVTHLVEARRSSTRPTRSSRAPRSTCIFYVPGEHDVIGDDGKQFFERFGKETTPGGWYSFDQGGIHFVALINVLRLQGRRRRHLGADQLEWLEDGSRGPRRQHADRRLRAYPAVVDLSAMGLGHRGRRAGTRPAEAVRLGDRAERPHPPGRAEGRGQRAVSRTAMSTAFPQPPAGEAPGPGPMQVPADQAEDGARHPPHRDRPGSRRDGQRHNPGLSEARMIGELGAAGDPRRSGDRAGHCRRLRRPASSR